MPEFWINLLGKLNPFKGKESPIEIKLSGRISLDHDSESFTKSLQKIFEEVEQGKSSFIIDLKECEFIYPSALIYLFALKESLVDKSINLDLGIEEGSPIHEYLVYCGAKEYFRIPDLPANTQRTILEQESKVVKIETGDKIVNELKKSTELVDMLKSQQSMSLQVETKLIDSIEEVLRNIKQHSSFSKYYILGQAYPTSGNVRFVFYDNGVGIKSHLIKGGYSSLLGFVRDEISKEQFEKIEKYPANLAIQEASRYMITGSDNIQQNSGAGLNFLLAELLPVTRGTITILSEDGLVQWIDGDKIEKSFPLSYKLKGTLVSITVKCDTGTTLVYRDT